MLTLLPQFGQVTVTELGEWDATESAEIDWGCPKIIAFVTGFGPT